VLTLFSRTTSSTPAHKSHGYTQSSRTTKSLWYLCVVASLFGSERSGQASTPAILGISSGQSSVNLGFYVIFYPNLGIYFAGARLLARLGILRRSVRRLSNVFSPVEVGCRVQASSRGVRGNYRRSTCCTLD
jgi:hypothetical protein